MDAQTGSLLQEQSLVLPSGFRDFVFPELQSLGPTVFDVAGLEPWFHPIQRSGGYVHYRTAFNLLKAENRIQNCFRLSHGLAIQGGDVEFFCGPEVPLWASVAYWENGDEKVPVLEDFGGRIAVAWRCVSCPGKVPARLLPSGAVTYLLRRRES